jgi:CheY-like chemotaxis protein
MIAPSIATPESGGLLAPIKRKRVLLVESSSAQRDLRSDTMRKLGIDVDCAADIGEARSWWRAALYNLVLIGGDKDIEHRDSFCDDVRNATPPQQLAFLVGKPGYLAKSPGPLREPVLPEVIVSPHAGNGKKALPATSELPEQRWGILQACQKISAVRAVCDARVKATRNRPEPPRDLENQRPKRNSGEALWRNEFPNEEIQ